MTESTKEGIRIKLDDPGITPADEEAALRVLGSGKLVNGSQGWMFENELTKQTERKYAIAMSSGTTALLAAMKALGVGPGSKVVVPAFTFPAPASAAAFLDADVMVCDVDRATFNLSPETIEPLLDDDVSLVIAIDQFGMPAPVPEIEQLLKSRGIPLLVDAACSIGATIDGKPCGSFGTVATLSFHPRKIITTGEGGAVLTDYKQVAARVRRLMNHGMEDGTFVSTGLNLRMPEVGAAIGLSQITRLNEIVERRRALAKRYFEALPLQFQEIPMGGTSNYQTLVAVLPKTLNSEDRRDLIITLRAQGIEANIASYCLGQVPGIARRLGIDASLTPVARSLHERAMALPLSASLTDENVDEVIKTVHKWLYSHGVK